MNRKNIINFAIGPIFSGFLVLLTVPFVSWFFSIEDVGRLSMLQVVLGLSVSFFSLAMHQAYVREYNEQDDKASLLKAAVVPGMVFTAIFIVIILAQPYSISLLIFNIESTFISFLLILSVVFSFFINFFVHILRMEERGVAYSISQILPRLSMLIFIAALIIFNWKKNFENLILVNAIALFFSFLLFLWLTKKSWVPFIIVRINRVLMKKMLIFSSPLVVGGLAFWGLTAIDRIFLNYYVGFEELGIYSVASSLAGGVGVLSAIFSNLWHPVVFKWIKKGGDHHKIQLIMEVMIIAVALVWSFVGFFSWILVYFLPSEYLNVQYLIVACIALHLFYMLSEVTVVGINISRKTSYAMVASIIALIVNIVFNFILIPEIGASGAALSSLIAFFVLFTVRTESSAFLWYSIPRYKIYIVAIGYTTATCIFVLLNPEIKYFNFVWVGLALLTLILFKKSFKDLIQSLTQNKKIAKPLFF